MLSEIQHGIRRPNTGNLYLQFKFRAAIQSFGSLGRSHFKHLAHTVLLSIWLEGERFSSLTSLKPPNPPHPLALRCGVTEVARAIDICHSVCSLWTTQRARYCTIRFILGYNLCPTVQNHSLPTVITPCVCLTRVCARHIKIHWR